jgi:hypothetical protein
MPEGYRAQGGRPTEKQQKLHRITMILSLEFIFEET